jgi:predicted O-methyltransferase YrrM
MLILRLKKEMLTTRNIRRGLRDPSLLFGWIRQFIIVGRARRDVELMNLVRAWSTGGLQRMSVDAIFPGIQSCSKIVLRKPESRILGWSLDLPELVHIIAIAKHIKAKRVLEIGTFDGFTTLNLAANLDADGIVLTLDLSAESEVRRSVFNACTQRIVGSQFAQEMESRKIRQLWGDSTASDWSDFGSPFDLVLIDGSHDYRYVRSDSECAIKHISPGGCIVWHDYGYAPDVSRVVDELAQTYKIRVLKGTRLACLQMRSNHCNE